MSTATDTQAYLRTKVLTAPPEELRLLLLDGAIKFLQQGRAALGRKDFEGWYTGLTKCRNILVELMTSVRPGADEQLYQRVTSLYTFMYGQLIEANLERDPAKVDRVLDLLAYERETWTLLMGKLAEERGMAQSADPALLADIAAETASAANVAAAPNYRPLSVQG